MAGFKPSYLDDVKIYEGYPILNATATTITVKRNYALTIQNNIYRVDDVITIAIGTATEEKATVLAVEADGLFTKLTFAAFTNTPTAGQLAGRKRFAGNIVEAKDSNNNLLTNVQFAITALDYTRIFDKELLNDTYENRDARYIVNDFCNVTVNRNEPIDEFIYANTTALRVAWVESGDGGNPTLDTSDYREKTGSGVFDWTFSGGTATFTNAITPLDISQFTGATSGSPTKGRV